ncbi:signal transduction histidine kinase [Geodermatophilus bullaregiensis]|nr:signal transduction histidine kinase [Geodermatophilus bullaregiensis]
MSGGDLVLAVLVAVLLEIGFTVSLTDHDQVTLPPPDLVGRSFLVAGALALAFRRAAPLSVLALNGAADVAYQAFGHRPAPLPLGVLIALYAVAVAKRPLLSGSATAAYVGALAVGSSTGVMPLDDDQFYVYLVSVSAVVTVGYGVALSRARTTLAEQRTAVLAREQDGRIRSAVRQERERIAREVHDVVANDVSVMVAQAAAARRVFDEQPGTALDALASIETVGRDAVQGLRRLLGLLRTGDADTGSPAPASLQSVPWLLTGLQQAGLPVDLTVVGTPRHLPAAVELHAFRIIQESLTNSLKHAGPTRASVTLTYGEAALGVEVRDRGRGVTGSTSLGHGLISMRERVAMLGGDLHAGPDADSGFRVTAELPMAGGSAR